MRNIGDYLTNLPPGVAWNVMPKDGTITIRLTYHMKRVERTYVEQALAEAKFLDEMLIGDVDAMLKELGAI